jgi:hypothetical protein
MEDPRGPRVEWQRLSLSAGRPAGRLSAARTRRQQRAVRCSGRRNLFVSVGLTGTRGGPQRSTAPVRDTVDSPPCPRARHSASVSHSADRAHSPPSPAARRSRRALVLKLIESSRALSSSQSSPPQHPQQRRAVRADNRSRLHLAALLTPGSLCARSAAHLVRALSGADPGHHACEPLAATRCSRLRHRGA